MASLSASDTCLSIGLSECTGAIWVSLLGPSDGRWYSVVPVPCGTHGTYVCRMFPNVVLLTFASADICVYNFISMDITPNWLGVRAPSQFQFSPLWPFFHPCFDRRGGWHETSEMTIPSRCKKK